MLAGMSSRLGSISVLLVALTPQPWAGQAIPQQEPQRRIAFADAHFATAGAKLPKPMSSIPGSQTDRGKAYIALGPPDEIRDGKCMENTDCMPHQEWTYRTISDVGKNVCILFVDPRMDATYMMGWTPCAADRGDDAGAKRRYELVRRQIERVLAADQRNRTATQRE